MKKIYENPMIQTVLVETIDVFTLSGGNQLPDEENPF